MNTGRADAVKREGTTITIAIELSDAAYAALSAHAKTEGKDVPAVAAERLEALYADCEPEVIEIIAEAFAEIDAGKDMPFEEYVARVREEQTRRSEVPAQAAV